ncbi:hypothetical protein U1Q18_024621, partial [Sarracenia purpurea var. burkii]
GMDRIKSGLDKVGLAKLRDGLCLGSIKTGRVRSGKTSGTSCGAYTGLAVAQGGHEQGSAMTGNERKGRESKLRREAVCSGCAQGMTTATPGNDGEAWCCAGAGMLRAGGEARRNWVSRVGPVHEGRQPVRRRGDEKYARRGLVDIRVGEIDDTWATQCAEIDDTWAALGTTRRGTGRAGAVLGRRMAQRAGASRSGAAATHSGGGL